MPRAVLASIALVPMLACESPIEGAPTFAVFAVEADVDQDLLALPYPNDLRLREDGTIDLARLGGGQDELLQRYLDLVVRNKTGGFGTNGAVFFRFDNALDLRSLPQTPSESALPSASVFWVNIDPVSSDYGKRIPFFSSFQATESKYHGAHRLALRAVPGFVLLPNTIYAVVITDALVDPNGDSVRPGRDFRALLSDDDLPIARLSRAYAAYAPLRAYLKAQAITNVVAATVFTTGAPAALVEKVKAVVEAQVPPNANALTLHDTTDLFYELRGTYGAPYFQAGTRPFIQPQDGGEILLDGAGTPKVAFLETLRFALTVPKGKIPAAGWPVVLYAHGTGGSYRSFISDGTAATLARVEDNSGKLIAKLALISIDQNLHEPRAPKGSDPSLTFFNFQNPGAAVDNVLQSGIDDFSLVRLVKALTFKAVAQKASEEGPEPAPFEFADAVKFDPARIYFMGHSQGSLTGPLFLAYEKDVKAAVLSAAGGGAALTLLQKTKPVDLTGLIELMIGESLDEFHLVLTLLQQMLEPADPNNYARLITRVPPAGLSPKHVFLSEGFVDHYTPPPTTEALAVAFGIPQLYPLPPETEVLGLQLLGLTQGSLPTAGNVTAAGQSITAGLLQYKAMSLNKTCATDADCGSSNYCASGSCFHDGHYVIRDQASARRHYTSFLATAARDGIPTILP
jgi:predicted esterase